MSNELEQQESEFSVSESRTQTTLHLKTEILDKIEEILYYTKKRLPRQKRGKLSKSKLYEIILEAVVADNKLVSKIISEWENA